MSTQAETLHLREWDTGTWEAVLVESTQVVKTTQVETWMLLVDKDPPHITGHYFDPNNLIRDFCTYLDTMLDGERKVVPIIREDFLGPLQEWEEDKSRYIDPTGDLRELLGTYEAGTVWKNILQAFFDEGYSIELGGNPHRLLSFFVKWGAWNHPSVDHMKGYIKKHAPYFWARYNEIKNAYIDEMTGLSSKNVFARLENAKDYDMCYLDLSGFKIFNDLYGHALGDDALRFFWRAIAECTHIRANDYIIHKWGDEFVILLKNRGAAWAGMIEEIQKRLTEYLASNPFVFNYTDKKWQKHIGQKAYLEAHMNSHVANGETPLKTTLAELSTTAKDQAQLLSAIKRIFRETAFLEDLLEYAAAMNARIAEIPEWQEYFIKKAIIMLTWKQKILHDIGSNNVNIPIAQMIWEDLKRELRELEYGQLFSELLSRTLLSESEDSKNMTINTMIGHIDRTLIFLRKAIWED